MVKINIIISLNKAWWEFTYFFLPLDVVEEFSLFSVLEDDKDVAGGVDEFKMLDDVRVVESAEYFDLPLYFFENTLTLNLSFIKNFDCYSVIGNFIDSH